MVPAARLGFLPLLLLLAGAWPSSAQTPASSPPVQSPAAPAGHLSTDRPVQTPTQASPKTDPQLPVDLTKIKTGVLTTQSLTLIDKNTMRIYVDTVAPFPKFSDMVGDFDLRKGPTPHAGMTHQEFVESTRPNKLYSSVGVSVGEMAKATVLMVAQSKAFELLRKGALAMRNAKTDAERKAIQARIEKELAALKGEVK
jgi:hypothetical protein